MPTLTQTQVDYLDVHNIPYWDEVPEGYMAPTEEFIMPDGVTHKFCARKPLNWVLQHVA